MVTPGGTPPGQICLSEANGSGFRKENLFQRKSERVDFVPWRSVAPGAPRKKTEKQQMGNEYWPGYDGSHSIKISNKEAIGTGYLAVGF